MNASALLLVIAVTAAMGALLLLWSRSLRRRTGLPSGSVVYSDTGAWQRCEKPLFSRRYGLSGRPDYLIDVDGVTVPVEVKSSLRPTTPYRSHLLQLAAYCLLVEDVQERKPPHGLLHYRDATLQIDYSPRLRSELLETLDEMRRSRASRDVSRSHDDPARCRRCGYGHACDQRLTG